MSGDDELSPKELIDEEETSRGSSILSPLPWLKEMQVGSAGEAWRLMLRKGLLTAFPQVAVLLGGPIGLGCHFCYLILCMWTRLICRDWTSPAAARETEENKKKSGEEKEENARLSSHNARHGMSAILITCFCVLCVTFFYMLLFLLFMNYIPTAPFPSIDQMKWKKS